MKLTIIENVFLKAHFKIFNGLLNQTKLRKKIRSKIKNIKLLKKLTFHIFQCFDFCL